MRYNCESCAVELDICELCERALRRGDLDAMPFSAVTRRDDKELYYRLQSEAGAYYNPDVEIRNTVMLDGIYYTVSGLADGIIRKNDSITVDKIKCVKGKSFYAPPDELTLGMLKCAAYFVCAREEQNTVEGRVSYYNTDTKKLKYFRYTFLFSELKAFYLSMLERIAYRARIAVSRVCDELPSASNAVFPYTELREGQETMIRECFGAIKHGNRMIVEAPTGTGKTISALFPAVRALGGGYCDKIFYLTPKTSTRREAFSAAGRLFSSGVLLRTVMISAKEQVCLCGARALGEQSACSSRFCEYASGYYDRIDGALQDILRNYRGFSRGLILEIAKKHRVCPYELSLDLSELCDIIICDYNYAFDPTVYFRRYFGPAETRKEKYVFLVDEAHNLADRAREMYSAELRLSSFERVAALFSQDELYGEDISEMLAPIVRAISRIKRLCKEDIIKDAEGNDVGFYINSEPLSSIGDAAEMLRKKLGEWLKKNHEHPLANELNSLSSELRKYLTVLDYFDKNFRFYAQISGGDIKLRLYCLDPSDIMNALLTRASASVMFSATMTPPEYFCDVLGGGQKAQKLSLPSPFPTENLCVAVADYINTRYDARENNARRFVNVIAAAVKPKAGNYIAYFPSYQCLEQTYEVFAERYPKIETVVQKKHMSAAQREEFLAAFKDDTGRMRIGFCVLGGVFSEGVDLPGSRLIGSIIFGVGLPGLSNERNIIKEHFDMKSDDGTGYDYAYTYPGMNNVLQAAGRVIRRAEDSGIVVLADDRYTTPKYRALFPSHWQGVKYAGNASSLAEIIRRFWENR